MKTRTFMIFLLTIVTMVLLCSAGAVVYADQVAESRHKFVGLMIFAGMFSAIFLGSLAMGYSQAVALSDQQRSN